MNALLPGAALRRKEFEKSKSLDNPVFDKDESKLTSTKSEVSIEKKNETPTKIVFSDQPAVVETLQSVTKVQELISWFHCDS